jgi:hypothetical protein
MNTTARIRCTPGSRIPPASLRTHARLDPGLRRGHDTARAFRSNTRAMAHTVRTP